MKTIIKNGTLFLNDRDHLIGDIAIENGKIVEISDKPISGDTIIDACNQYVLPGFIDIHMHGSYGYDFVDDPFKSVQEVSKGLVSEGVTSFMASLTVVSFTELKRLLRGYGTIKDNQGAHFLGVHSEGPYLSKEYKALMNEKYLKDPSIEELDELLNEANGSLKIMTIAPEREGSEKFIKYASSKGITMMIGHSNATCKQASEALKWGARGFTHLYNAMSPLTHRTPGCVAAAFLDDKAYCELIVDGFHINEDVIKLTYKYLGSKRITLITDCMLAKGMRDGDYTFSDLRCHKKGNTVQVIETGRIAGSAISMLDAFRNMQRMSGCSINNLVEMACINPAIVAQVDKNKGSLSQGKDGDIIILNKDLSLAETLVMGKCVYEANS